MRVSMILRPLALFAVLAVIAAAFYLVSRPGEPAPVIIEQETAPPALKEYADASFGIAFQYPETYVESTHDAPTTERVHRTIVLTDAQSAANLPENGEGPTTISIDMFGNKIDNQSVERFIRNTSASNYKLSPDQVLASTTIAGRPALRYVWEGLYRGESVVFEFDHTIFMFTVTSMDSTDPIRTDFEALLKSVRLSE